MMTKDEALKLALEAFEAIPEEIEGWIPDKCTDAVIAIKEALAQPEQEHVATSDTSEKRVDEMAKQRHEPEPVIDKSAAIRIATALGWEPKRKPLTDEEIGKIAGETLDPWSCARAIEAAHGIKE